MQIPERRNKMTISVGILEDNDDMRAYLCDVVEMDPKLSLSFNVATLGEANRMIDENEAPDICLVDLNLPDGNGADFVSGLTQHTKAKALILTVLGDRDSVMAGFSSGAHGYLLKDTDPEQITRYIFETCEGGNPISAQVSTHLLDYYLKSQSPEGAGTSPEERLTKRETDILTLFAKGLSYRETADTLGISTHTVNDYVKSIYSKLYVNSRNEAVFEAMQLGWIKI